MRKSVERSKRSGSAASGKKDIRDLTAENNQRIARLAEEIGQIQIVAESEKAGVGPDVDYKLKILEGKLSDGQNEFGRRYNNLKTHVDEIQKTIDAGKIESDSAFDSIFQEMENIETKLHELYDTEAQKRREYENRVELLFSERITQLKDDLSNENEEMSNGISQITEIYEADLKKLQEALSQEITTREEADTKRMNETAKELSRLNENAVMLRKIRDESEDKLQAKIKETVDNMKDMMAEERMIREKNHSNMIDLLEEAWKNLKARTPDA